MDCNTTLYYKDLSYDINCYKLIWYSIYCVCICIYIYKYTYVYIIYHLCIHKRGDLQYQYLNFRPEPRWFPLKHAARRVLRIGSSCKFQGRPPKSWMSPSWAVWNKNTSVGWWLVRGSYYPMLIEDYDILRIVIYLHMNTIQWRYPTLNQPVISNGMRGILLPLLSWPAESLRKHSSEFLLKFLELLEMGQVPQGQEDYDAWWFGAVRPSATSGSTSGWFFSEEQSNVRIAMS